MSKETSAANTAKKKKRPGAGKIVLICLGAALAVPVIVVLLYALFSKDPVPQKIPEPTEQAAYEIRHIIKYWPEDADYLTCDYACIMDKPVFSRTSEAGAAMNKAVDAYFDGLFGRIEKEYMQAGVAKPPYTEVACSLESCRDYTCVLFTEKHCYEAQPYTETRTVIMDGRGGEVNANDVFRTYHAEERIAEAVLGLMNASGYCYDDVGLNDVLARLDISHRFTVDDGGATVFLPEGVFAPYDRGELAFTVPAESIVPKVVGSAITMEEYEGICGLTDAAASACIVRETDITGGELTPYAATAFMGACMQKSGRGAEKGRIPVPAAEFEAYYRACFGNDFPGIDRDGFDIKLDNGVYSVSASQKVYEYHVDILGAERSGNELTIDGEVMFGGYGYPYSTPVCRVTIRLIENAESPYGFTLRDYNMSL
ncbi:MAG: hypothetical protein K6F68_05185 [Clostridiales bacterium]|nr:hypothetical protein [Clostridiales bacterium]